METDAKHPKRKPLRLKHYDYSSPGAYFVTICTGGKRCFLSKVTVGAIHESPLQEEMIDGGVGERSLLDKAVGYLKMNSSRQIHSFAPDLVVWQRAYYDHVVRDERDYAEIWDYMEFNPLRWAEDSLHAAECLFFPAYPRRAGTDYPCRP